MTERTPFVSRLSIYFTNIGAPLALLLLLLLPQSADAASIGGRPANPRPDNPRSESIFVHTVEPGQVIEEGVKIVNPNTYEATVEVYGVDSLVASGGAFSCEQNRDTANKTGEWLNLEKNEYQIGPQSTLVVPFTIDIPENASVGEHNACITIQEKKEKAANASGITLSFRNGIRVALLVPGDIIRSLDITGFGVTSRSEHNDFLLQPRIYNAGNTSVDADVSVEVATVFGNVIHTEGGQYPILREQEMELNFEYKPSSWGGWYKTVAGITYDENPEARIGEQVSSDEELVIKSSRTSWFFVMPGIVAWLVYIVIIAIIAAIIVTILKKRRFAKRVARSWKTYTVRDGDTITSVADAYAVDWKVLASVNSLKAPYNLTIGAHLKVPPVHK